MARRRKGLAIHGWINVDKPSGISSNDVVTRVRRATGAAKVGHGGTLDPLATGVLPVALGEATKTVSYAMDGTKTYRFRVRWGVATATDDAEGEVVETSDARPGAAEIEAALGAFTGEIEQVPPAYSAIKVDGRRSYELARRDEAVEGRQDLLSQRRLVRGERAGAVGPGERGDDGSVRAVGVVRGRRVGLDRRDRRLALLHGSALAREALAARGEERHAQTHQRDSAGAGEGSEAV